MQAAIACSYYFKRVPHEPLNLGGFPRGRRPIPLPAVQVQMVP